MIRLSIPGLPPSTNLIRKGWRHEHRAKTEWVGKVVAACHDAGLLDRSPVGSKGRPLRAEVVFVLGPKHRASDTDNRAKALQDALQQAGVISNDRHIEVTEMAKAVGPEDRTLVKLFEIPPLPEGWVEAWWAASDSQMELYFDAR